MPKLVRNLIPKIMKKKGELVKIYIADEKEYNQRLSDKLIEEVLEYKKEESLEELAYIMEVLEAIFKLKNITKDEIEKIRLKKQNERGSFDQRIILINEN